MKKVRIVFMVGVAFLLTFSMAGCSKGTVEETFDSKKIADINIITEGNNIIFRTSSNDNIKVTLEDCDSTLGTIKERVLNISTPASNSGINVSGAKPLYIYLPEKQYENITTNTKTGNVEIQDIDVLNLNLTSEYGKIHLYNMSGALQAIANMGTIETKLEIAKNIIKDEIDLTQKLSGKIGGTSKKNIMLKTNTGKIILN